MHWCLTAWYSFLKYSIESVFLIKGKYLIYLLQGKDYCIKFVIIRASCSLFSIFCWNVCREEQITFKTFFKVLVIDDKRLLCKEKWLWNKHSYVWIEIFFRYSYNAPPSRPWCTESLSWWGQQEGCISIFFRSCVYFHCKVTIIRLLSWGYYGNCFGEGTMVLYNVL